MLQSIPRHITMDLFALITDITANDLDFFPAPCHQVSCEGVLILGQRGTYQRAPLPRVKWDSTLGRVMGRRCTKNSHTGVGLSIRPRLSTTTGDGDRQNCRSMNHRYGLLAVAQQLFMVLKTLLRISTVVDFLEELSLKQHL